jgi:hypothetical protein
VQEADHRHGRLLRARRKRPDRRAAEERDELASLHSITSSARASSVGKTGSYFIASARYWIKFVRTAKYKTKPHAIAINTNQIAIFPKLGTFL